MRILFSLFIALGIVSPLFAQMHTVSVEKLPLGEGHHWSQPVFSPDGAQVYFTADGFNGIWEYTVSTKSMRRITNSPRSGFGFALSSDGKTISYRRTYEETGAYRTQELVTQDLSSGATKVLERAESVSLPRFFRSSLIYMKSGKVANSVSSVSQSATILLGIENTKIVLLKGGKEVTLDPLGNGSYIWPSLSPDGAKLVAYEMDRGAFVCDLDGNVITMLGKKDNPVWTHDGKWIVYMNDRDDGYNILSSDIYCVSPDGKKTVRLTDTNDIIELYPYCSPVDNRIVCSSLSGDVYVITYSEEGTR